MSVMKPSAHWALKERMLSYEKEKCWSLDIPWTLSDQQITTFWADFLRNVCLSFKRTFKLGMKFRTSANWMRKLQPNQKCRGWWIINVRSVWMRASECTIKNDGIHPFLALEFPVVSIILAYFWTCHSKGNCNFAELLLLLQQTHEIYTKLEMCVTYIMKIRFSSCSWSYTLENEQQKAAVQLYHQKGRAGDKR